MSGEAYSGVECKFEERFELTFIEAITKILRQMIHDVNYIDSGDDAWSKETADAWFLKIRGLCCALSGESYDERIPEMRVGEGTKWQEIRRLYEHYYQVQGREVPK